MGSDEFDGGSGGRGRKLLLFAVLLVVVGAFVYDLSVIKPQFRKGVDELNEMLEPRKGEDGNTLIKNGRPVPKGDQDGDGVVSTADVHKLAGREPAHSYFMKTDPDVLVEVYSWRRGIPLLSYNAYVVYKKFNDGHRMYSVDEAKPDESRFGDPILPGELPEGLKRQGGGNAGDTAEKDSGSGKKDDSVPDTAPGEDEQKPDEDGEAGSDDPVGARF
jgi:hypothetical protein